MCKSSCALTTVLHTHPHTHFLYFRASLMAIARSLCFDRWLSSKMPQVLIIFLDNTHTFSFISSLWFPRLSSPCLSPSSLSLLFLFLLSFSFFQGITPLILHSGFISTHERTKSLVSFLLFFLLSSLLHMVKKNYSACQLIFFCSLLLFLCVWKEITRLHLCSNNQMFPIVEWVYNSKKSLCKITDYSFEPWGFI